MITSKHRYLQQIVVSLAIITTAVLVSVPVAADADNPPPGAVEIDFEDEPDEDVTIDPLPEEPEEPESPPVETPDQPEPPKAPQPPEAPPAPPTEAPAPVASQPEPPAQPQPEPPPVEKNEEPTTAPQPSSPPLQEPKHETPKALPPSVATPPPPPPPPPAEPARIALCKPGVYRPYDSPLVPAMLKQGWKPAIYVEGFGTACTVQDLHVDPKGYVLDPLVVYTDGGMECKVETALAVCGDSAIHPFYRKK